MSDNEIYRTASDLPLSKEHLASRDNLVTKPSVNFSAKSSHLPRSLPSAPSAVHSPFSNVFAVNSYNHSVQYYPPYVLDKVAHLEPLPEQQPGNSAVSNVKNRTREDDLFLNAIHNNWGTFVQTVQASPAYTSGQLEFNAETTHGFPDLSGKWEGHERLRAALNSDDDELSYTDRMGKRSFIFRLLSGYYFTRSAWTSDTASLSSEQHEKKRPKIQLRAGYWMLTHNRADWKPMFKRILLNNPYIPLTLRLIIIIFCATALALAADVYRESHMYYGEYGADASTIMALCVQTISLAYLLYITYDEFSAKPIGLRNPMAKLRLIMLDLLFVIFSAANLTLAFYNLYDTQWLCSATQKGYPELKTSCERQRALVAFLLIILCMWVTTFTVSIVRVVERVSPGLK
ncbi:hypothetical protein BABINDRAFT_39567 [Babjeviella inositovora NRRL Y-12698]|uniref:Regulator of phospholipase D SRF1 n=1 Tax=Babjeviella inositovora NRRL Y-12698 TaxID=984486 RepID=A0A1E3QL74_9ASCO|nr:uncharacterized protein BABINDRAFT_39567 [Babjeviella inositovora NRRL Y-12698]ODQ78446.1 hypothetical protein BABINDRAFT_39567 [Babjeviella inositovora NRRL Y-12698]